MRRNRRPSVPLSPPLQPVKCEAYFTGPLFTLDLANFIATFQAMTHTVNVAVLKNSLSEFLGKVQSGDSILVCSRNKPVAKITPLASRPNRSTTGFDPTVQIHADLEGPAIPPEDWGILAGPEGAR